MYTIYYYYVAWLGSFLQAQRGNAYFTELAERVEYGNYVHSGDIPVTLRWNSGDTPGLPQLIQRLPNGVG